MLETYEQKAKYGPELPSTPISALIRSSTSSLQLFLHHHLPSDGSKAPPSLTQPQSYFASCTPRNSNADAQSRHRVADTTLQISSRWSGFAVRTNWRSSKPSAARRPTSYPPRVRARCRNCIGTPRQSLQLVRNVNKDGIGEGRVFFFVGGTGGVRKTVSMVPRTSTSPRPDVDPQT